METFNISSERGKEVLIVESAKFTKDKVGILRTLIDYTFFDRRQTQKLVWRELICRDTTVFYIT
jgi:hypothetical protein